MSDSGRLTHGPHRFAPAAPDEDIVHGACCPGWHTVASQDAAIDDWISVMQRQGIERVCCLLTGRQLDARDANIGCYRTAFGPDNVRHAPIPDHHLADEETLRTDILPFLDDAVADDAPVVVHCLAGIGRTGHVLAAWLVHDRDMPSQDAIDTVREMGRDPTEPVTQGDATEKELLALLDAIR